AQSRRHHHQDGIGVFRLLHDLRVETGFDTGGHEDLTDDRALIRLVADEGLVSQILEGDALLPGQGVVCGQYGHQPVAADDLDAEPHTVDRQQYQPGIDLAVEHAFQHLRRVGTARDAQVDARVDAVNRANHPRQDAGG